MKIQSVNLWKKKLSFNTKAGADRELKLAAYFSNLGTLKQDDTVRKIKTDCGWELKTHAEVEGIKPLNTSELALLRLLEGETC
ncbi:hypothetical protein ES708_06360 [subsurface metagenome]